MNDQIQSKPAKVPSAHDIAVANLQRTPAGQELLKRLQAAKTPTGGSHGDDLSQLHTVDAGLSPIRATISGDVQTIAAAGAMIDGYTDVPATLKQFLKDELAELTTNACELHLHLLDMPNGDVTLQVHIKGVQLGPKNQAAPIASQG